MKNPPPLFHGDKHDGKKIQAGFLAACGTRTKVVLIQTWLDAGQSAR